MFPKLVEGLSLIIGMCVLMHTLFADERNQTTTRKVVPIRTARQVAPGSRRAACMAFGSSLLVYALAEIVIRGM